MSTARQLLEKVVEPGLCIGCGACAVLPGSPLTVRMNAEGRYQAAPAADGDLDTEGALLKVCPFSSEVDEDALARAFIQPTAAQQHPEVGVHQTVAAGHVHAGSFRGDGSSGGMTSWFLDRLLAEDEIDGVLHVTPRGGAAGPLFKYSVSTSRESAAGGAGTRYYPVEMSGVLSHVRENPGRYAVVGVPCFIKAVRLLQLEDPVFRERVRYCVGIVCGHFKSARFAESLGWEKGIQPGELEKIDFRVEGDVRADLYDVSVSGGGTTRTESKDDYLATDWEWDSSSTTPVTTAMTS
ncbi:Coenzyme F420 hydrogenase/dehydrogenase, beta subunit C-terminal domain [Brachybacterium muris]|uniref:Coenzyme F420 hydrogenase/dehydrogenase, beta subunit C-terminal domain n=1 Tax=Brachybacterium muris TaxID=219301 RepID=UPI000A00D031|nr:Coenzyme F420 hydrogenase/dehydrogenase, beta subunit C-terminal domain [Brachybacterium muris]